MCVCVHFLLEEDFLAADFLATDFLATDFLATDFLATDFSMRKTAHMPNLCNECARSVFLCEPHADIHRQKKKYVHTVDRIAHTKAVKKRLVALTRRRRSKASKFLHQPANAMQSLADTAGNGCFAGTKLDRRAVGGCVTRRRRPIAVWPHQLLAEIAA